MRYCQILSSGRWFIIAENRRSRRSFLFPTPLRPCRSGIERSKAMREALRDDKEVDFLFVSVKGEAPAEEFRKYVSENLAGEDVQEILIPRVIAKDPQYKALYKGDHKLWVNPTGKFVIGGPHGDTGLTGRKIIVDTYGGKGSHGGGAFSGKDPSKVDRSAAYEARHIAKNLVAAGIADEVLVQIAYAIGMAEPVNIYINTYGTAKTGTSDAEIADKIRPVLDLRPKAIEERLKLRNPIYEETAAYGHMGRKPRKATKTFITPCGREIRREVELFTWEKTDLADDFRRLFFK